MNGDRRAQAAEIRARLDALAGENPLLAVDGLAAGYGAREILHGIDLRVAAGQSLCLIGPNGAGKSTILHAIFGLAADAAVLAQSVERVGPLAGVTRWGYQLQHPTIDRIAAIVMPVPRCGFQ